MSAWPCPRREPVTLNVGNNGQSTTYSGNLSGGGGLTKQGGGVLTLNAARATAAPPSSAAACCSCQAAPGTVAYNFDNGTLQGWSTVMSGAYSSCP